MSIELICAMILEIVRHGVSSTCTHKSIIEEIYCKPGVAGDSSIEEKIHLALLFYICSEKGNSIEQETYALRSFDLLNCIKAIYTYVGKEIPYSALIEFLLTNLKNNKLANLTRLHPGCSLSDIPRKDTPLISAKIPLFSPSLASLLSSVATQADLIAKASYASALSTVMTAFGNNITAFSPFIGPAASSIGSLPFDLLSLIAPFTRSAPATSIESISSFPRITSLDLRGLESSVASRLANATTSVTKVIPSVLPDAVIPQTTGVDANLPDAAPSRPHVPTRISAAAQSSLEDKVIAAPREKLTPARRGGFLSTTSPSMPKPRNYLASMYPKDSKEKQKLKNTLPAGYVTRSGKKTRVFCCSIIDPDKLPNPLTKDMIHPASLHDEKLFSPGSVHPAFISRDVKMDSSELSPPLFKYSSLSKEDVLAQSKKNQKTIVETILKNSGVDVDLELKKMDALTEPYDFNRDVSSTFSRTQKKTFLAQHLLEEKIKLAISVTPHSSKDLADLSILRMARDEVEDRLVSRIADRKPNIEIYKKYKNFILENNEDALSIEEKKTHFTQLISCVDSKGNSLLSVAAQHSKSKKIVTLLLENQTSNPSQDKLMKALKTAIKYNNTIFLTTALEFVSRYSKSIKVIKFIMDHYLLKPDGQEKLKQALEIAKKHSNYPFITEVKDKIGHEKRSGSILTADAENPQKRRRLEVPTLFVPSVPSPSTDPEESTSTLQTSRMK